MLEVSIIGAVQVLDQDGQDRTPKSKKTRGLVALLMFSKDFRRARSWLQDKLWSDRGAEQGAASLRQALTELRRALGPHRDALITEKGTVQLDPNAVTLIDVAADSTQGYEICEDLDGIRDPEFENWLRDRRMQQPTPAPQPRPNVPFLVIGVEHADDRLSRFVSQLVRDDVVRSILELGDVRIFDMGTDSGALAAPSGPAIFLRLNIARTDTQMAISVRVETLSGNWIIWQSPCEFTGLEMQDEDRWRLRCLAQSCVGRIHDEFERQSSTVQSGALALGLAHRALKTLFQFRRQDLIDADLLLKSAYEMDPRGVYLSWRAFIRNTAMFEHLTDDFLEPCEGYELHAQALADDPLNSYTLVFAGQHSFVNDGDPVFGQSLCDKALEINPGNAMGWGFRSNMLIVQGKAEQAAQASRKGVELAQHQPCLATLLLNGLMSEMAAGQYSEAIAFGRMGQMTPAKCQAMRRFLFAIFRALEMPLDAERQLSAIRTREPEFSPTDMLRSDYPTWTLQKLPIADRILPPGGRTDG